MSATCVVCGEEATISFCEECNSDGGALSDSRKMVVAALRRVYAVVTSRATPIYPGPEAHEALWCEREDEIRTAIDAEIAAATEGRA